ncbi:MAG: SRPBCC family protein [Paludibacteraceae bacterium]
MQDKKIVEIIKFDFSNPDFGGEMIMEITLQPIEIGTRVTFLFKGIPIGIRPEDNEAGTILSLEKSAKLVES